MPRTHTTPYMFFSLWFAWFFGIMVALYVLASMSGLFDAFDKQDGSPIILFVLKLLLFAVITIVAVHLTCKSYILLTSDLLPVLKYYWIFGAIFIFLMFIRLIVVKTPVLIALIDLTINVSAFVVQSIIFYFMLKIYAMDKL